METIKQRIGGTVAVVFVLASACAPKDAAHETTASATETSGVPACEDFFDADGPFQPRMLEIHNEGSEAILLPTSCWLDYLAIRSTEDWIYPGLLCSDTCENGSCVTCGGCGVGIYVRVEPGGKHVLEWPGYVYQIAEPPIDCGFGTCDGTCPVRRTPPSGNDMLQASIRAVPSSACEQAAEDVLACTCESAAVESCEIVTGVDIDPTLLAKTSFVAAASGPVVITFP